jgi:hypothetical protein
MKSTILVCILLLKTKFIFAQKRLIKTIESENIQQVAMDRAGDVYLITSSSISKYDKDGKTLNTINIQTTPTSFDTGNGVRLLMYKRKDQQYTIFSPTLEKISETTIDNSIAIEPWLVCSAGDLHLLILDAADWSIKKIDKRDSHVEQEFKIDPLLTTNPSFVFMREYQNLIFLYDAITGLSIFNNIGIQLKNYQIGTPHFNFLGHELYYLKDKKINFIDLLTGDTRQVDLPGQYNDVLITDERLIKISANRLDFFEFQPQ